MPNLTLKNTGPIQAANIQLQGLTILIGASNTGKTTLAKALYCTFAAQEKRYPTTLQAFQEAMQQLRTLEQEYGLHQETIVLADIAPKVYLSFYQRAVEKVVKTVQELGEAHQGNIRRVDAQRLVRSCNILRHLNNVDLVATVVQQFKTYQLVAPKELLLGKAMHDVLIDQLFEEAYVNHQANEEGALLDLYEGNTATVYQRVQGKETIQLTFKGSIFSEVLLLDIAAVLDLWTGMFSLSAAPVYTQTWLKPLLDNKIKIDLDTFLYKGLESILGGQFIVEEQQFYYHPNHGARISWRNCSPCQQQIGLFQLLAAKGLLTTTSLLILDEPILAEKNLPYLEALSFLIKSGIHLIINTKNSIGLRQLIPCGYTSKSSATTTVYEGKKGEKGNVFEEIKV
ncbi:MAG: hypothetical protein ACRBFS_14630 [Aureispira sp.]